MFICFSSQTVSQENVFILDKQTVLFLNWITLSMFDASRYGNTTDLGLRYEIPTCSRKMNLRKNNLKLVMYLFSRVHLWKTLIKISWMIECVSKIWQMLVICTFQRFLKENIAQFLTLGTFVHMSYNIK